VRLIEQKRMTRAAYSSKVQQLTILPLSRGERSPSRGGGEEVIAASRNAEQALQAADADLVPLGELIRRTPGAHRIGSIGDLRCDAFDTEEELEEFLAFVAESRRGASRQRRTLQLMLRALAR
jgi:hypothetical protein